MQLKVGPGNMGIITHYYIQSIQAPKQVISFEVYWNLPDNAQQIATFLKLSKVIIVATRPITRLQEQTNRKNCNHKPTAITFLAWGLLILI